jgi:hypothetical protein
MCYGNGLLVSEILEALRELIGFIDTRVYNFTVYDNAGSVLVTMTGFELKRNSTSLPPGIVHRYEVALQPLVVSTVPPRFPRCWSRPDKETATLIMTVADHEAQLLLRQSLDDHVTVGDDLSRQRYYQFAKDAARRPLPPLPPPSVVKNIMTKWPIHFQIIDRLRRVHREIFANSMVSPFETGLHEVPLTHSTSGHCSSPILR